MHTFLNIRRVSHQTMVKIKSKVLQLNLKKKDNENDLKFLGDKRDRPLSSPNKNYRHKSNKATAQNKKNIINNRLKRKEKNFPTSQVNIDMIFLYKPYVELPDLSEYLNQVIEIRLEKCYINWNNPCVMARKIWGTDNYTSNSDAVCILFHSQFMTMEEIKRKNFEFVSLFCTVGKGNFFQKTKNS